MIVSEERERERLLTRLRKHFASRRSPRTMLSLILIATGGAGFIASFIMLRCGVVHMAVRYPLAVLGAWGIFLALVRAWAAREADHFREDEHLGDVAQTDDLSRGSSRMDGPLAERKCKRDRGGWLDWLDLGELFSGELEGLLFGLLAIVALAVCAGAVGTLAGLIGEAEVLIAELFLDAVLLSAFSKRLSRLKPQWWVAGVLRQTMWPVLLTACTLMFAGVIMEKIVPDAKSIGGVWRHYHPAPVPAVPKLERGG